MSSDRQLVCVLRVLGCADLLALVAVVMPWSWMAWGHQLAGLGEIPDVPIVGYLTRSASALYALHGAILVFLSLDVTRYRPLIRVVAGLSVLHGAALLVIDANQPMPLWWTLVEGTTYAGSGVLMLILDGGRLRQSPEMAPSSERPARRAGSDVTP